MKATGIIRRIDQLGRIVIPKEIRKTFKLKEGDAIEFFIENNHIYLEKYSLIQGIIGDINEICSCLQEIVENSILFVYEDEIHAVAGDNIKLYMQTVSKNLRNLINERKSQSFTNINIINERTMYSGYITPILVDSELLGTFVLINDKREITDEDIIFINLICKLITRAQDIQKY